MQGAISIEMETATAREEFAEGLHRGGGLLCSFKSLLGVWSFAFGPTVCSAPGCVCVWLLHSPL